MSSGNVYNPAIKAAFDIEKLTNYYKLAGLDKELSQKTGTKRNQVVADLAVSEDGNGGSFGSSSSSNNSSSNKSSSLFGTEESGFGTNSLFGGNWLDGWIDKSKDLARFRLGLDQDQAKFSRGLREEETQSDFGRNYKLAEQQIGGQTGLETLRQNATTERLRNQLDSQQLMQQRGFDQQNLFRQQSAALASRGLR